MIIRTVLLLCLLFRASSVCAAQSEISSGLDKLADSLIVNYKNAHPSISNEKVTIFKFNASKELEEKRIGFAVSELLTHRFATKSGFIVLERLELDKLLAELKINMSGAINPDDALKCGKLGGAKLLVLGSVEKIGNKYHVNARLIEIESGQVSSTAYEAFPVSVFENEAKNYLASPPEIQRIGIYALANWRHNTNVSRQQVAVSNSWGGTTTTVNPKAFNLLGWGIGLRYSPSAKLTLDFSAMSTGQKPEAGHVREENNTSPYVFSDEDYSVGVTAYRGLLSLKKELSSELFIHLGAGFTAYRLATTSVLVYNNTSAGFAKTSYITPTVQFRAEYFLQARVGISLSGSYDFVSKTAIQLERDEIVTTKRAELDKLYFEPTISVYF